MYLFRNLIVARGVYYQVDLRVTLKLNIILERSQEKLDKHFFGSHYNVL